MLDAFFKFSCCFLNNRVPWNGFWVTFDHHCMLIITRSFTNQSESLDSIFLLNVLLSLNDVIQVSQCLKVKATVLPHKRVLDYLICQQFLFLYYVGELLAQIILVALCYLLLVSTWWLWLICDGGGHFVRKVLTLSGSLSCLSLEVLCWGTIVVQYHEVVSLEPVVGGLGD